MSNNQTKDKIKANQQEMRQFAIIALLLEQQKRSNNAR
jgi:hypothetical protein